MTEVAEVPVLPFDLDSLLPGTNIYIYIKKKILRDAQLYQWYSAQDVFL